MVSGCGGCFHGVLPEWEPGVAEKTNRQYMIKVVDDDGHVIGMMGDLSVVRRPGVVHAEAPELLAAMKR